MTTIFYGFFKRTLKFTLKTKNRGASSWAFQVGQKSVIYTTKQEVLFDLLTWMSTPGLELRTDTANE